MKDCVVNFMAHYFPDYCPFERTFKVFGKTIHIPPLCQLNPFFDEVMKKKFEQNGLNDFIKENDSDS